VNWLRRSGQGEGRNRRDGEPGGSSAAVRKADVAFSMLMRWEIGGRVSRDPADAERG
jgi:hypothetical protein